MKAQKEKPRGEFAHVLFAKHIASCFFPKARKANAGAAQPPEAEAGPKSVFDFDEDLPSPKKKKIAEPKAKKVLCIVSLGLTMLIVVNAARQAGTPIQDGSLDKTGKLLQVQEECLCSCWFNGFLSS